MNWCCFDASSSRKKDCACIENDQTGSSTSRNVKFFRYKELVSATGNFDPRNKIGRGGFGTVFKGTLKNGRQVAIKVLSQESKQGIKEFFSEIDTIANVKHVNLIELLGCCTHDNERILVYDYAENGSLDCLFLGREPSYSLDWSRRRAICIGTASGLMYLHEEIKPPIVHRDIKASNILLDRDLVPKIGDFGLAKLFPNTVTHISTRVAGTTGYLAPEYAMGGRLTKKADIYSFGILVLEIVSGRKSSGMLLYRTEKPLLELTWQLYEEGRLVELVDPVLKEYPEEEVFRFIKVALFCTQGAAMRRPTMAQVFEMLSKPVVLNEEELTPPGLLPKAEEERESPVAHNLVKFSSSKSSSTRFISGTMSFTDIIPR